MAALPAYARSLLLLGEPPPEVDEALSRTPRLYPAKFETWPQEDVGPFDLVLLIPQDPSTPDLDNLRELHRLVQPMGRLMVEAGALPVPSRGGTGHRPRHACRYHTGSARARQMLAWMRPYL
jgi:hypothetical protein